MNAIKVETTVDEATATAIPALRPLVEEDARIRRVLGRFETGSADFSDYLGILTADEARGTLRHDNQGSIDVPSSREQAQILEVGPNAFNHRKDMCGL